MKTNNFACGRKDGLDKERGGLLNVFLKKFFWAICIVLLIPKIKKSEWGHTVQVIGQLTFSNLVYVLKAYACGHDLDFFFNYAALNCRILQLEMLLEITHSLTSYYRKERLRCRHGKWPAQEGPAGQRQNRGCTQICQTWLTVWDCLSPTLLKARTTSWILRRG